MPDDLRQWVAAEIDRKWDNAEANYYQQTEGNKMTIKQITETAGDSTLLDSLLGENVFIRTVTYHYTGRLTAHDGATLRLADAAWIADSGRFTDALKSGDLNEVEPFPGDVWINAAAVVDISVWGHDLPRTQK